LYKTIFEKILIFKNNFFKNGWNQLSNEVTMLKHGVNFKEK